MNMYRYRNFSIILLLASSTLSAMTQETPEQIAGKNLLRWASNDANAKRILPLVKALPGCVNITDEAGRTPLMLACNAGAVVVTNILAPHVSDINQADDQGYTALMYSIKFQSISDNFQATDLTTNRLLYILIKKHHAHLEMADHDGNTALLLAIISGKINTIHYLLSKGANPHHCNQQGKSALILAFEMSERFQACQNLKNHYQKIATTLELAMQRDPSLKQGYHGSRYKSCRQAIMSVQG